MLKIYSFVGAVSSDVATGGVVGVGTGVVEAVVETTRSVLILMDVAAAGFLLSVVGVGRGLRSVTDQYGCKLRKGLVSLGLLSCDPGVVDAFLACFFFFLFSLLWVIYRLPIDYLVSCVMGPSVGSPYSVEY